MNLFFKSYRVRFIFFLLITCETCINWGFAQSNHLRLSPWIQEINLPSQYREIPNQTFFCNSDGTLFIGKVNGLNIISERRSSYLFMEGPVYVSGDASDTLYYAARNDLGLLIRQENGSFRALSKIYLLPASKRSFIPLGMQNQSGLIHIYTDTACLQFSGSEIKFLDKTSETVQQLSADTIFERKIKELVESEIGIPPEKIRQIVSGNDSEIWILGDYTLHQMYYPSPLSKLPIRTLHAGRILTTLVQQDRILLGTSQGILQASKDQTQKEHWTLVNLLPIIRPSIQILSPVGDMVFAAGKEGLYVVGDHHADLIDKGSFTGIFAFQRGIVLASDQRGIVRYKLGSYGWESSLVSQRHAHSHTFTGHNNNTFFLCYNGVFRINSRADKITPVPVQSDDLLYRLQKVGSSLFLIGKQQVYSYDANKEVFQPLSSSNLSELILQSDKVISAGKDKFWILKKSGDYFSRVYCSGNLEEPSSAYDIFPALEHLGEITDIAFADSVLFLTGKDRVSLFDLHLLEGELSNVSIKGVDLKVSGKEQSFHISGFELQHIPEPLFRYMLLPRDTTWSEWNSRRDYTISGLRQGKYALEVQAMDLFGRVSETEQWFFTIPPPFYARWYAFLVYGFLFLALIILIQKWWLFSFQRAESRIAERMENKIKSLAAEKEKSDKLVAEMLPESTANQIISQGKARWDKYDRATVLFSDIQGFTKIAEEMNPEKLIDELDSFFFHFDSVVEKYNIEKIKTIGDAYMAAGGIPHKNSTNPVEVVMAALEMQAYMKQLKTTRANIWDLRIGIHTGPVIAGVVGHKKISYDIWGDTVNTASRMESSGTPGKINISGITYGMVKDYFLCEYRGKLPVKYKGNIDMYYVNGLRPELAVDLKGIPNKRFYMQLQLMRLGDLEEKVFEDILEKHPESLHFHRPEYVKKVYKQSFLLCRSEEIEAEGQLLVRTAALMLFTGLSQNYHNFENRSAVISRDILPGFSYSDNQIDQICNLILATKKPFNPKNRLEKILIDARMEYLGSPDFTSQIQLLYQEMKAAGSKINGQQFKKQQQELLYDFYFFTTAAQRLREVSGNDQMTTLEKERWI
jgi:class 3 adenylate cyclase